MFTDPAHPANQWFDAVLLSKYHVYSISAQTRISAQLWISAHPHPTLFPSNKLYLLLGRLTHLPAIEEAALENLLINSSNNEIEIGIKLVLIKDFP